MRFEETGRRNGLWLFGCNIYVACRWRYSTARRLHLNPASCHQDASLFHWKAWILPKELKNTSLKRLDRVTKEIDRNNMFFISNTQELFEAPSGGHSPTSPVPGKGVSLASKVEFSTPSLLFSARQRGVYITGSLAALRQRKMKLDCSFGGHFKLSNMDLCSSVQLPVKNSLYVLSTVLSSISCPFSTFRLITSDFIVILMLM